MVEGKINPKKINEKELKEILSHPRLPEYDEYYDRLIESSDDEQINAVGFLVDAAYVKLNGSNLTINLLRDHYWYIYIYILISYFLKKLMVFIKEKSLECWDWFLKI